MLQRVKIVVPAKSKGLFLTESEINGSSERTEENFTPVEIYIMEDRVSILDSQKTVNLHLGGTVFQLLKFQIFKH